jgi:nucleoside-diphosphate-sugar epimerase
MNTESAALNFEVGWFCRETAMEQKLKIIITGATGFIGRNLAEAFFADGMEVAATGRNEDIGKTLFKQGIHFKTADITSLQELEEAFCPADCAIHCAAKSGDWGMFDEFYQANVIGTLNVVAACRTYNIKRLLFISTPSVYVDGRDRYTIRESETLPTPQLTHYSMTKLIAEQELLSLPRHEIEIIIFRPRAVYGPYDNNFVPRIMRMAKKKRFPLIAGGRAIVDVTYIENLVDLVRTALNAPSAVWNQVYNVSNGDPITIARWFEKMLGVLGLPFRPKNVPEIAAYSLAALMEAGVYLPFGPRKPLMTKFAVRYMARSMTLSKAKVAENLAYQPRFSTEDSFHDYAERISTRL